MLERPSGRRLLMGSTTRLPAGVAARAVKVGLVISVLSMAGLGVAACSGDGDVVLPSDTKAPVTRSTATTQDPECARALATTTTTANAAEIVICAPR